MTLRTDRETIARWADKTGLTRALGLFSHRSCLIVVNLHRIGDASQTTYDPGTFSATADQFYEQVAFLKARFHIVTLEEVVAYAHGNTSCGGPQVLLTFDDGYLDNYEQALPVLRAHNAQATFFLPTSYVGTDAIPWWDAMAYQVRTSQRSTLRLRYPAEVVIECNRSARHQAVRTVLDLYKSPGVDSSRFREELAVATGVSEPVTAPERLFMHWGEVAKMIDAGMAIGSHTHSHQLLSRMTTEEQLNEFVMSRQLLESKTGIRVDTLAFPVGSETSFTPATCTLLEQAGYRAGFSFHGGINLPGRMDKFNLYRMDGDLDQGMEFFELRTTVAAVAGRDLL